MSDFRSNPLLDPRLAGSMSSRIPTWREDIAGAIARLRGQDNRQGFQSAQRSINEFEALPFVGQAVSGLLTGNEAYRAGAEGDYVKGGLLGLAAIAPVPSTLKKPAASAAKNIAKEAIGNELRFFHGGPEVIQAPRITIDPDGLLPGFSITPNRRVAEWYAGGAGRPSAQQGVVSEFTVDNKKLNTIDEFDLYNLTSELENKYNLDEGDLTDELLLEELNKRGINAVKYREPEFGVRVLDPSILVPIKK